MSQLRRFKPIEIVHSEMPQTRGSKLGKAGLNLSRKLDQQEVACSTICNETQTVGFVYQGCHRAR